MRVELARWGLGDTTVDPGEVLLRLVTQSAARVELYSRLLEEAYEAGERLRVASSASAQELAEAGEVGDQLTALEDLRRIFTSGGVAALVGYQYNATKDGDVYATGEAIRGLAKLEAEERDRCMTFAAKAVAAGLAERQVRIAEQAGAALAVVLRRVLSRLGLSTEQTLAAPRLLAEELSALATTPRVLEGQVT